MEQGALPPPPEPPLHEAGIPRKGFHLPGTNFFKGFRRQIAVYEAPPNFKEGFEPVLAAIGAFILSAFFTLFISLGQVSTFSPIFSGDFRWVGSVFLAPPVEEAVKGLSVVVMAFVISSAVPNRRYAVAIGVAAGLGYALSEDITYFGNPETQPTTMVIRLILNPIGHPVFTALCAVGVFVFVARLKSGQSIFKAIRGLPLLMWIIAVLNHSFWNAWQFGVVPPLGYTGIVLSIFVVVLPFVIILRDFLGGHFNFGHFFEPIPEPSPPPPTQMDNPPPPMPVEFLAKQETAEDTKLNPNRIIERTKRKEGKTTWMPH